MTPAALCLNLSLSFTGLALLALSLDRHHRDAFGTCVPPARARSLRLAGWLAIGLSLAAAVFAEGANFGPVQWVGSLTGAALAAVALLSYRPGWLRPAAMAAVPLALLSLLLSLRA